MGQDRLCADRNKWNFLPEVGIHLKGLYATRRIGLSTSLIWFSDTLGGILSLLSRRFQPAPKSVHF